MHPQLYYPASLCTSLALLSTYWLPRGVQTKAISCRQHPEHQEAALSYPWTPDPRKGQHLVFPCYVTGRTRGGVTGRPPGWSELPEKSWLFLHPPHSDLLSPHKLSGSKLSAEILAPNLHNPFFQLLPRSPWILSFPVRTPCTSTHPKVPHVSVMPFPWP